MGHMLQVAGEKKQQATKVRQTSGAVRAAKKDGCRASLGTRAASEVDKGAAPLEQLERPLSK